MKKKFLIISMFVIFTLSLSFCYAHSGRTDKYGGHKDNNNVSGLGSYHYHCGGHEAHLHPNGVCPYSNNTVTTNSNVDNNTNNITTTEPEVVNVDAEKVEIVEKDKTKLQVGQTLTLSTIVTPDNTTDKSVKWISSNKDVLKVNSDGRIEAKSKGTSTLTVKTSNGKTDTMEIIVVNVPEEIKIKSEITELTVGQEYELEYEVTPLDSEADYTWSSSDEDIITVNENGKITAIKEGIATIYLKTDNSKVDNITITVKTESSTGSAILGLAAMGGIGAYVYNKKKKQKQA